jgi:hypothetical protein
LKLSGSQLCAWKCPQTLSKVFKKVKNALPTSTHKQKVFLLRFLNFELCLLNEVRIIVIFVRFVVKSTCLL